LALGLLIEIVMPPEGRTAEGRIARFVAAALAAVLTILLVGVSTQAFVPATAGQSEPERVHFYFWGVGCPHCREAEPFAESLKGDYDDFEHRWYEVKKDKKGRRIFKKKVKDLKIANPGIPAFICNRRYVIGYTKGKTENLVRDMLDACRAESE
jgi:hypothetical protein